MKRSMKVAALIAAVAIAGAGCGSDEEETAESGTQQAEQAAEPAIKSSKAVGQTRGPAGESPTPTSDLKLTADEVAKVKAEKATAALVWHTSSDFVSAVQRGAEEEFGRLGIEVTSTTDAGFDAGKQKSDIETVLAKKPDVMLTLPVDPVATAAAYRDANEAGTEIVLLSNVPKGFKHDEDYIALLTDDLFQMGKQAADALAASMDGQGKVGYVFHDADYYVTNQRDQAFKKTIEANYPEMEIVAEQGIADPAKAEDVANAMLTRNPGLGGIYVTWSEPAEGVLTALRNAGSADTKLVTLDLSEPVGLDMARDGAVAAIVADRAYDLGKAMATAAAYGVLDKPAPEFVVAPAVTVTKANLRQGWQDSLRQDPPKTVLDALG